MTFRLPHLFAALVLHAAILLLLAGGVQCSVKPIRAPVITGVLLDPSRQEVAQRKREEQRRVEADRKRQEEEARRAAEQQKKVEARKRALAEADARKKKDAEALRLKQLADKKAADQKAAERKKAEAAARTKQEQLERERVERAMQEEATRREADQAAQAQADAERLDKIAEWAHALVRHVQANYRKPPGAPDEFACQVRMQLLPDGTVTNTRILKSCGSVLLDQAVADAVQRSSPLPRPADPSVFDRDLTINFTP
jgi:colicin import membrane protein